MTNEQKIATRDRIILTELGEGTGVLLDLDTKFYFTLNATGVFVWKCIEEAEGLTTDSLAKAIHERFEVDLEPAKADVEKLLATMTEEGLLV